MVGSRRRRIVRRALTALAVVLLLFSSYFSLWVCHDWGRVAGKPLTLLRVPAEKVVFAPIDTYLEYRLPGAETLWTIKEWSRHGGTRSWQECHRWNPMRTWGEP
jgi:hypothetical protein